MRQRLTVRYADGLAYAACDVSTRYDFPVQDLPEPWSRVSVTAVADGRYGR